MIDELVGFGVDSVMGWFFGWLVGLAEGLFGLLVDLLDLWLAGLVEGSVGWLVSWLIPL